MKNIDKLRHFEAKRMIVDYSKKIEKLQKDIAELEEYLIKPENPNIARYEIAEAIHSSKCRLNHIDQCSWDYETWDITCSTRQYYLTQADTLIAKFADKGLKPDVIIELGIY